MSLLDRARHLTDHSDAAALKGWPLRRRAVLAGVSAAGLSLLVVALPVLLVWVASPQSTVSWTVALGVGADGWLLAHGVSLGVGDATLSLTPWLLTAIPLVGAVLAGRRVVALVGDDDKEVRRLGHFGAPRVDVLEAGAGFVGAYTPGRPWAWPCSRAARWCTRPRSVRCSAASSCPSWPTCWRCSSSSATRSARSSPTSPRPGTACCPGSCAGPSAPPCGGWCCSLGSGLLLALGVVVLHLERIGRLYDSLGAGVVGGVVAGLAQLALLPNLGVWALAWMAGPGFGIGDGSHITWTTSDPGLLPLVPVLGALPDPGPLPSWLWLAVLVPIAIGVLVGWRSLRAVSRLSTWQIKAETSATACALCAVALTVAVWLSSGSAGADRLAHVGANPWAVGAALLGELLLGAALTVAGSHLRARRG